MEQNRKQNELKIIVITNESVKGKTMIKRICFILIALTSSLSHNKLSGTENHFTIHSLEYLKEIIVPQKLDKDKFDVNFKLKIIYSKEFIIPSDLVFDYILCDRSYCFSGRVLYYNKSELLNNKYKLMDHLTCGAWGEIISESSRYKKKLQYKKGDVFIIQYPLISKIDFEYDEIGNLLKKRILTKIIIFLNSVDIYWKNTYYSRAQFADRFINKIDKIETVELNRSMVIKVKYEK
jgi:hypothetical protein